MSRGLTAALVLAAAATFLRAQFIFFPTDVHIDEPIIAGLAQRAVETGRLTANWEGVANQNWSRPTYQFSPYTLIENGLALASNRLFGVPHGRDEQIRFARGVSVACGGLAVLATYCAARAWFVGVGTALIAESLVAAAFLHVQDSCYGRVEAMLSLAIMLAFWASGAAMNAPTTRRYAVLGLAIGVVVAMKYNAAPILLLAGAPLFTSTPDKVRKIWVALAASVVSFLVATPEFVFAPSPLIEGVRYEIAHYSEGHIPHQAMDASDNNLKFWANYLFRLGFGWAPMIAVLGYLGLAWRRGGRDALLALFLVIAAVLTVAPKVRFERNAEVLLGPACLAAARFLNVCWFAFPPSLTRVLLQAGVAVGLTGNLMQHGVALYDFRRQQKRFSSPLVLVPEAVRRDRFLGQAIQKAPPPDWDKYDVLLLSGYSDAFSQRALKEWEQRLRQDWDLTLTRCDWYRAGYPFSTVEAYHGPGFILRAEKKRKGSN